MVELKSDATPPLVYRFQVFAGARGILMQLNAPGAAPAGVENAAAGSNPKPERADTLEELELTGEHFRLMQVTLLDQTDAHNELVSEREWLIHPSERIRLDGNLFILEDILSGRGLILLKLAPLPHARPIKDEWDLEAEVRGRTIHCTFAGHGTDPAGGPGYRYVTLAYSGGRAGRIETIQAFQRQLRRYEPGRDAMFLSNTWGDRSRDMRINAEFMSKEIEAGSRLGVDVIQIDDGWQQGRTANSGRGKGVWNGFWAADSNFWLPDQKRFPGGLAPLVKQAAAKGMRFGLWYAPDSSNDFANWERDAARLLELHREDGIDYFKIDGVKATTKASEDNLRRLFDRVLAETKGKVVFDLDVTAEIRPGYFGMVESGPVFVENRYTDAHRYWPHQTLRNLWKLAQYVDPARLRFEFLNNARNTELYSDDPLAPATYSPEFLFATTMFASPLGWFEVSNLPPAYQQRIPELAKSWKEHRSSLFAGTILPIGSVPDGTGWTGFVSYERDQDTGYILVFRGLNSDPRWVEKLPVFLGKDYQVKLLGGAGKARIAGGKLEVEMSMPRQFLWVQVKAQVFTHN